MVMAGPKEPEPMIEHKINYTKTKTLKFHTYKYDDWKFERAQIENIIQQNVREQNMCPCQINFSGYKITTSMGDNVYKI